MDEPVLARLTRRRFLAFLGLAAAGGAAAAVAATEFTKTAGPAQSAASAAPLIRRRPSRPTPVRTRARAPRRRWL